MALLLAGSLVFSLNLAKADPEDVATSTASSTISGAADDGGTVCTEEWKPVCGQRQVECIKAPCPPIAMTYSNRCQLDAAGATFISDGTCASDKTYGQAEWTCSDAATTTVESSEEICRSEDQWKEEAQKDCQAKCADGSTCEAQNVTVKDACGSDEANEEIADIKDESEKLAKNKISDILDGLKEVRDLAKERRAEMRYLRSLVKGVQGLAQSIQSSLKSFIAYGVDDSTKKLGEGERAAVLNSYKDAFDKLPQSAAELADAIKIANGRWPSERNAKAEDGAKERFKEIYRREADMSNNKDDAAVTIMAYGLRQKAENRKLESERKGLDIFKGIFKHLPLTTEDWNTLQAITYSGASR